MASQASRKRAAETPVIPDRLYFKIGDVARICGVETYVLRFWETQFPQLKPNKSGTGQRLYRRRDVELALEIKRLVHAEGYTLAGARQALEGGARRGSKPELRPDPRPEPRAAAPEAAHAQPAVHQPAERASASKPVLAQIRSELRELVDLLSNPQPTLRRERAKILKVRPDAQSLFPL